MTAPPKRGRPAYLPNDKDRRTVEAMLSYGMKQEDVAAVLGVDPKTLRKHYPKEIRVAALNANAAVKQSLYLTATGWMAEKDDKGRITGKPTRDAVLAAIFWDKTRGGAIETQHIRTDNKSVSKTDATVAVSGKVDIGFDPIARSAELLEGLARRLAASDQPAAGLADDGKT